VRGLFFFSPDLSAELRRRWWERTADVPMSAFGHRLRLIVGLDLRPRLSAIRAPALVVTATDDRVVPRRSGAELARLLPCARLLRLRVGHAALAHPRVDVARLLADPACWPTPAPVGRISNSSGLGLPDELEIRPPKGPVGALA
jgi:pimeloyl-ACP methyl ester carboxylesterase